MDIRKFSEHIRTQSEQLAKVVSGCKSLLRHSPKAVEAKNYIHQRLSKASIDNFDIGYFPPNDQIEQLYALIGKKTLCDTNILWEERFSDRGHMETAPRGFFNHHNLIFPYLDEYGNIVALAGRSILSSKQRTELKVPKYKNTVFHKSMHLFGLNQANKSIEDNDGVIIVEGQIDAISCHANGFFNTVAMTGSELTLYQAYLIKKKTDNIYLLLDNDDAGRKAASKIIKKFAYAFNIRKLVLPIEYNDVDEYLHGSADRSVFNVCYG